MAVDFPNNPARDELFFAEGTTWKWTGVAWAIVGGDGTPTEIVGADAPAGWQVWGDVLIQWGFANTDATGNGGVTFQKPFKNNQVRVFTDTYVTNAIYDVTVHTTNVLAGGFSFIGGFNGGFAGVNVQWFAIGEARDEDKKAKVVHSANGESAGGGGASVEVGEVPPENPSQGDMWFATGESVGLYVWYGDEDSSQWVMTNGGGRALNAVQRTGDTMTGQLAINKAAGDGAFILQDGAGITRWALSREIPNGDLLIGRFNSAGAFQDAPIRIASSDGNVSIGSIGTLTGKSADFSNGVTFGRTTGQDITAVRDVIYAGGNNMAVTQLLNAAGNSAGEQRIIYVPGRVSVEWWRNTVADISLTPSSGIRMNMGSQAGAGNVVGNWDGVSRHIVTVSSSEGITKRSIKAVTDGLAAVMALKPVTYRPASEQEEDRDWPGFIVEDVVDAGLHDLVVNNGPDLPRGLAYDRVSVYLVNAVQQLSARVEELSAEVEALKNGT